MNGRGRRHLVRQFLGALALALCVLCVAARSAAADPAAGEPKGGRSPAAEVKLRDQVLLRLEAPLGDRSPAERARDANQAVERALREPGADDVKVERRGELAVLSIGSTPVLQLGPSDAEAAGAASLDVHAAAVASRARDSLRAERQRERVAQGVFSVSLAVFFALVAVYLLRKVGEFAERARAWIQEHPEAVPRISLRSIEVVRPPVLRSAIVIGLGVLKWLGQVAVVWIWLSFVLSLFESTRATGEKLTGVVLSPVSALAGRLATSLPLLLVAAVAALVVFMAVRFVGLFFASVARGETDLDWLPRELAAPTSVLVRAGMVVSALIFLAPLVTGDPEGALVKGGVVALGAAGLAATPLLASVVAGSFVVFSRRLKVGEWVDVGGRTGRVVGVGLADVTLESEDGGPVTVPHLLSLWHPTRVHGRERKVGLTLRVAFAEVEGVRGVLLAAASRAGAQARVDVEALAGSEATLSVSAWSAAPDARARLAEEVLAALLRAGVAVGAERP